MKKLRVTRIKIITSKGRIEKGETVILSDEEYQSIILTKQDAFEVLGDVEPDAPKPGRKKAK
jgi:hypothetical protein